ncbi:Stf0 sulfotransferase family protein [Nisaea acidiphila]|uniref:Stf0 sulfotransferase family protein n=1 Tax=Nisaea acidiphila TaxID=1862145 RepID=A0A9J7B2Q6_9PROT|nr:Stf0 sulfotransferase family protein [Nisaea acidiphila]UUX51933.1 Stf0 sulfotransferase family protein [Nisaea acidiphila]
MTYQSLVLCSAPRSGSTLFCDLLAGTGVAGNPHSFFRREDLAGYAEEFGLPSPEIDGAYLEAVIRQGTGDTGIFAVRIMWETLGELDSALECIHPGLPGAPERLERAFGRVLYVHLTRSDKVAQAISYLKAQQTGLWHRYADGSERERMAPPKPAEYDSAQLADLVARLTAADAGWTDWLATHGIAPVRVDYDDLSRDPRAELAKVLRALGRDSAIADRVEIRAGKLADAESAVWAERYRRELSS